MYHKIYIIGPVGSGKTYFATKLSKLYNINHYELDKVSWDDDNGNIKREDAEVARLFQNILNQDKWIIEDVGRTKFAQGREDADIIYYIKLSKIKSYYRVTKRLIKQRLGKEKYNFPPNLKQWFYYLSIVNSYYKKEKTKLKQLEKYKEKLKIINNKDMNNIIKGSN